MGNGNFSCVCCLTVKECVQNLNEEDDKENLVASLWGAERCLRVLESVSTAVLWSLIFYRSYTHQPLDGNFSCDLMPESFVKTLTVSSGPSLLKVIYQKISNPK